MSIASFSIKQKVLVNLITIAIIVFGLFSVSTMQREGFPNITTDYAIINTLYPNASPEDVEDLITIPIEEKIGALDGIETYASISRESFSTIIIEMEADADNKDTILNNIIREADKAQLPADAEDPVVNNIKPEMPLLEISFSGQISKEKMIREHVKELENILKNIEGVASVTKVGWREREISIEIKPENLDKYYVSLPQIINSIKNSNISLPGGKFESDSKEMILRTMGEVKNPEDFGNIIVRTNPDGKYLFVKDVAEVLDTYEERKTLNKTGGKYSINLIPKKKTSGDIIRITDSIKKELKDFKKRLPDEISVNILNESAERVKLRLNTLTSNGIIGLVMLIALLLLFLNVRIAFVTSIGIPFAFLAAMAGMSYFGVTLNMITMFGLIIVLGMIVDDAIVISENVYRYMEAGMPPKEAAVKGASELAGPVTTTILSSLAAFVPLMFLPGMMGKVLKFFPMGVIWCLVASLFEALVILPSHLAEWSKPLKHDKDFNMPPQQTKKKNLIKKIFSLPKSSLLTLKEYLFSHDRKGSESVWFKALLTRYTKILSFATAHRYFISSMAGIVIVGSVLFAVKIMPFKLFPGTSDEFVIRLEAKEGTSLEDTDKQLSKIEKILLDLPDDEMKNITATVGYWGSVSRNDTSDKNGSHFGQCVAYLTNEQKRKRNTDKIISSVRKKIQNLNLDKSITIEFEKTRHGPPVGKPVSLQVKGAELTMLENISAEMMKYMKTLAGVYDIKDSFLAGKDELHVFIDKPEAARLGLDIRTIASTIRQAYEGGIATTIRKDNEDIDVIVRLTREKNDSMNILKELTIPNNTGRLIKLNKVAYFKTAESIEKIHRDEGRRTVTISARIDENITTSVAANKKIFSNFSNLSETYPGYFLKEGGEWEDTKESVQAIFKAFIIAFVLIYIILATQFQSFLQPFIIMVSVPFGIIGVIAALYLHGLPISMLALMGTVGLVGVVVNDSLILVNFINTRRKKTKDVRNAVIDAGRTRLRPILLTSITTIVALMPMIYGIGGSEPFLVPSAIAMAYGLLCATVVTLVIVPCVYLIIEDIKNIV